MSKSSTAKITKSEIKNWSDIVELHSSNPDYNEYFSNTVKKLLLNKANAKRRSFVVTSPASGEGKTTMAVNIAAVLASWGKNTILIDADFKSPDLEEFFNISDSTGLLDVISGTVALEDAVIQIIDYPSLHLLTRGSSGVGDLSLTSGSLDDTIKRLHEEYDYVIFDTASTGESMDPILLAGAVDAAIIVALSDQTSKDSLSFAKRLINRNNGEIAGVILNKVQGYVPTDYRNT
ncbi:MAG: CpsD/CapB family tyrosine-protein kinase [Proteobacteria bacterium]|nr:CpsD/CapB family tyrosine-protein kinase [Pseudomonadota bacterium]